MKKAFKFLMFAALLLVFLGFSGRFLVANRPEKSDVIVVLAGETEVRPACGVRLLNEGYAPFMLLDVPANAKVYQWKSTELAEKYVETLPQRNSIRICPIQGLSTKAEVENVQLCLQGLNARSALIETSEYHSRRAFSIFSSKDKSHAYSISACSEPVTFGVKWWQNREWAKTTFYEWIRLLWWELVDRWR